MNARTVHTARTHWNAWTAAIAAFLVTLALGHIAVKTAFQAAEHLPPTPAAETATKAIYAPMAAIDDPDAPHADARHPAELPNRQAEQPEPPAVWTQNPLAGVVYEPAPETDTNR